MSRSLPYFIARRYLFSKKSSNAINIITLVAMTGIMVGTAALIITLSVFNGLSTMLEGLFSALDPDIRVVAAEGKHFEHEPYLYESLRKHPEVTAITRTVEDRVVMQYGDRNTVPFIKGVEPDYTKLNPIDSSYYIFDGEYNFEPKNGIARTVMGFGVAMQLGANLLDEVHPISIRVLSGDAISTKNLLESIRTDYVFPSGFFTVQKEYNDKYALVDFAYAQELLDLEGKVSAYEIAVKDLNRVDKVRDDLIKVAGDKYRVITWYEQHETLYKVMRNEKYIGYLILSLLVAIAAINIVGSLSMIVLEKTRDISVLRAMGIQRQSVRWIFLTEGLLVGGIGATLGMVLAFGFGILQEKFGILALQGGENFRINAFPIEMRAGDFLLIFVTVMTLSLLASLYPSWKASQIKVVEGLKR
ncbi:MAG: ABC transporter permease [Bacteroidota bacterium]